MSHKEKLLRALAYCVEILCNGSLMDGRGAICAAIETDLRIWDFLDDRTKGILSEGLGIPQPPAPDLT